MLLAFLIYNDGIGTIIRMAGLYGAELKLPETALDWRDRHGPVRGDSVRVPLRTARVVDRSEARDLPRTRRLRRHQHRRLPDDGRRGSSTCSRSWSGRCRAAARRCQRSLFATMVPRHKSSEFFGFFAVFEKFAGIFGPALFAVTVSLTGSSRQAILSVIAFFVVGALLLAMVDVEAGQRAAREEVA